MGQFGRGAGRIDAVLPGGRLLTDGCAKGYAVANAFRCVDFSGEDCRSGQRQPRLLLPTGSLVGLAPVTTRARRWNPLGATSARRGNSPAFCLQELPRSAANPAERFVFFSFHSALLCSVLRTTRARRRNSSGATGARRGNSALRSAQSRGHQGARENGG